MAPASAPTVAHGGGSGATTFHSSVVDTHPCPSASRERAISRDAGLSSASDGWSET